MASPIGRDRLHWATISVLTFILGTRPTLTPFAGEPRLAADKALTSLEPEEEKPSQEVRVVLRGGERVDDREIEDLFRLAGPATDSCAFREIRTPRLREEDSVAAVPQLSQFFPMLVVSKKSWYDARQTHH
jgi:hypothetical protein